MSRNRPFQRPAVSESRPGTKREVITVEVDGVADQLDQEVLIAKHHRPLQLQTPLPPAATRRDRVVN